MIASRHAAIACANHACVRRGEPFVYLDLSPGDSVMVRCPACGWISTHHLGEDGRITVERRSGTVVAERATRRGARQS